MHIPAAIHFNAGFAAALYRGVYTYGKNMIKAVMQVYGETAHRNQVQ